MRTLKTTDKQWEETDLKFHFAVVSAAHHVIAIHPDGTGDVSDSHVVWHKTNVRSYVPSPVVISGRAAPSPLTQ